MVADAIEHRIFYPKIRQMGIQPDPEDKAEFAKFVTHGTFSGLNQATLNDGLAIYYFQALLLLDDDVLRRQIDQRYLSNGWNGPVKLGKAMAQIVLTAQPATPSESITAFVACANILLGGKIRISIDRWGSHKLGNVDELYVVMGVR